MVDLKVLFLFLENLIIELNELTSTTKSLYYEKIK